MDRQIQRLLVGSLAALAIIACLFIALLTFCFLHHLHWGSDIVLIATGISSSIMMLFFVRLNRIQTAQKQVNHVR